MRRGGNPVIGGVREESGYRAVGGRVGNDRRAGEKGERRGDDRGRVPSISKKISTICRHSNDVRGRRNGFIARSGIMGFSDRGGRYLQLKLLDVEAIVDGGRRITGNVRLARPNAIERMQA